MALRVVFFGNSGSVFTSRHFSALLAAQAEISAVVEVPPAKRATTNPLGAGLLNFVTAARAGRTPAYEPASPNDEGFIAALRALEPELFIAVGYPLILKAQALSVPRLLSANFHASLLPHYRGRHPVFWTLRGGEAWAGLTVHAMDAGIDTGDILYQVKIRTRRDDTVAALYERIIQRSVGLVPRLIADARRGTIPRRPQPAGQGSYFSATSEADFRLDWGWPAERLRRWIVMTPGKCFADIHGQRVFFLNADTRPLIRSSPPGRLLALGRAGAAVASGSKEALWSSRVRMEDRETTFTALCRQLGLGPGDSLL